MIYLNCSLKKKKERNGVIVFYNIHILDINLGTIRPLVYYDEPRKRTFNAMHFVAINLDCQSRSKESVTNHRDLITLCLINARRL